MARIRVCANEGCGAEFVPRCNRQLWCDACLRDPEALRRRDREYKRRRRRREKAAAEAGRPAAPPAAPPPREGKVRRREDGSLEKTCLACGEPFAVASVRQVRCPACQKAERRWRLTAYMRKWRARRKPGLGDTFPSS